MNTVGKNLRQGLTLLMFVVAMLASGSVAGNSIAVAATLDSAQLNYTQGKFEQAAIFYQKVLEQGVASEEVYFNLGNSYFKMSDIPSAILYYEKALKIAPNNEDVRYNLEVANSQIVDRIEAVKEMAHITWLNQFVKLQTPDSWAILFVLLFVVTLLFVGIFLLASRRGIKKFAFVLSLILLFSAIVTIAIAFDQYQEASSHNNAIIFAQSVTIKSQPNQGSTNLFVLHDGTKVTVMERVGEWSRIKIASGSVGWILSEDIREI